MKETYTREEAMNRLGLERRSEFLRLEKRYPDAFVVVIRDPRRPIEYDKTILDQFAKWRERFKEDNYEHNKA